MTRARRGLRERAVRTRSQGGRRRDVGDLAELIRVKTHDGVDLAAFYLDAAEGRTRPSRMQREAAYRLLAYGWGGDMTKLLAEARGAAQRLMGKHR